jgi:hypothetical protein
MSLLFHTAHYTHFAAYYEETRDQFAEADYQARALGELPGAEPYSYERWYGKEDLA